MLVQSVSDVTVQILKSFPPQLSIQAMGQVNTGGWANIRLEPAPTISPGQVLAFNMVGDPPTGPAIQVITPVQASIMLVAPGNMPATVQVNASANSLSVPVSPSPALRDGMNLNSPPPGYREEAGVAEYRAVRLGSEIFVHCNGVLNNANELADLRMLPIRIFPPQLGFCRYAPQLMLPAQRSFAFVSRFAFPANVGEVVVNDAEGSKTVPIHEPSFEKKGARGIRSAKGEAASSTRATGHGDSLQEAVDNAIQQLPAMVSGGADILFRYRVIEQGKIVGGFVGFNHFFAEVERNP